MMSPSMTTVFLAAFCVMHSAGQGDGNPHHWSRERRCDQWPPYDPPCGVCEGYGGVAYGDLPDQINMTTCEIVENPKDPDLRIKPVWPIQHFEPFHHVRLIGGKVDPSCSFIIPTNSSAGELCYGPWKYNNQSCKSCPKTVMT